MINNIGIIGYGFVGQAIAFGFSPVVPIYVYDKDPNRCINSLEETVNDSDIIFVSVPTPMRKDGSIDLSIVYSVFESISEVNKRNDNIFIIKSTVVPGTTTELSEKFPDLNIIFNPEFLTERKAKFDFLNQARIVIGGPANLRERVRELYDLRFNCCNYIETDYQTAEFIKYFNNVYFAVKVSFANEMKRLADKAGVNWQDALAGFVADGRVADSHLQVPGPDGKLGFGGTCFPKDICAFINFANNMNSNVNIIKAAWQTNLQVRPECDWEKLEGRAVSKEEQNEVE